ncbi:hypothetical protein [Sporolactobacillus sp. KGMB 08714]|uniref:hypothetical protein n=1 Tax=Sporolactobacillus sp. KGMB 08714 TaxID=3064704 RepID=UPI002FBEBBC6
MTKKYSTRTLYGCIMTSNYPDDGRNIIDTMKNKLVQSLKLLSVVLGSIIKNPIIMMKKYQLMRNAGLLKS